MWSVEPIWIEIKDLNAKSKKLKAKWSVEDAQDMLAFGEIKSFSQHIDSPYVEIEELDVKWERPDLFISGEATSL